jgi:Undecaprenyl-phosphate glucose phosphotransferase
VDQPVERSKPPGRVRKSRFTSNIIKPLAFLTDLLCLIVAGPLAYGAYALLFGSNIDLQLHFTPALLGGVGFLLIRLSRDAYSAPMGRAQDADQGVVFDYMIAALLSITAVWQLGLIDEFSRGLTGLYIGSVITLLYLSRFALRQLVWGLAQSGHIGQRIVLYGDTALMERAYRLLELERLPHLSIMGIADDRRTATTPHGLPEVPFIGGLDELIQIARSGEIDQVLIALPDISQQRLEEILSVLSSVSVDVSLIPRETLVLLSGYKVRFIGATPILSLWQRPIRDIDGLLKTAEDRSLATLGLIFLLPLLLLSAAAIKLTSPGPVLFTQKRFGFNNNEISVIKFRTMYVDRQDATGAERTTRQDARVTPVGRILRRLSIDELPQLWNVLKGDMSLVGPRPHATHMKVGDRFYFDAVKGYAARHRVKPGITGLAQIRGLRGEIATIERARRRVDYDRYYIDNWSLMLDIRIILITIFKLIGDRNAY